MVKAKLIFKDTGEEVEVDEGSSLREPCEEQGIPFACRDGLCGTCIVSIDEGNKNLTSPSEAEIDFLGEEGCKEERMCCQCAITTGTITISQ